MADPGEGPGGPAPFFLDQTEARRAENIFLGDRPPPYLRVWMTPTPPPPTHNLISVETHHMSSLRLEMSRSIIQIKDNVSSMYISSPCIYHHMSSLRLEMSRSIIQIKDNVSSMYISSPGYPANLPFLSNEGKMCLIRTQPRR